MYFSCIFAGKRQKGHPCAFLSHLAQEWTRDLLQFSVGLDKRPVCYLYRGVYLNPQNLS